MVNSIRRRAYTTSPSIRPKKTAKKYAVTGVGSHSLYLGVPNRFTMTSNGLTAAEFLILVGGSSPGSGSLVSTNTLPMFSLSPATVDSTADSGIHPWINVTYLASLALASTASLSASADKASLKRMSFSRFSLVSRSTSE